MDKIKETFGSALGFVLFVLLLPALMWCCTLFVFPNPGQSLFPSLSPDFARNPSAFLPPLARTVVAVCLAIIGLALSIWAIIYMRRVGEGNPMDAFGHEVAPHTKHLMTDGPYRLSRNPMLTGIFLYLTGCCVWLWSWQAVAVFVLFVLIMLLQVRSEEQRLRRDFGDDYEAYCRKVGRFLPFTIGKHVFYNGTEVFFYSGLAEVEINGKWGYINHNKELVINAIFDDALPFYNGAAPVSINEKWGLVDVHGNYIIELQYDDITAFHDGLALAEIKGKSGYIDMQGNVAIPFIYDFATVFRNGYAFAKQGENAFYINKKGERLEE